MSVPRIVEVLRDQALLLDEKVPGYRALAVKTVVEVLALQNAGHSEKGRRERATALLDAVAQQVAVKKGVAE